jgi:peptidyl-prolyl cis-trans isomerase A (cyclophilin A)
MWHCGVLPWSLLLLGSAPAVPLAFAVQNTGPMPDAAKPVRVLIHTEKGEIELELDAAKAPVTVANYLRYVDARAYDNGRFHRTVKANNQPDSKVKIAVVQAGIDPKKAKTERAPIKLERTRDTRLLHKDGTISMARDGPDTATSDFFICVGDQPELDFGGKRNPDGQGFAAFGKVSKGMDVVRKIQAAPAEGQTLTPPVKILKVRVAGNIRFNEADGRTRTPLSQSDRKATVLFFLLPDCPISNSYMPEIQRICADYEPKTPSSNPK